MFKIYKDQMSMEAQINEDNTPMDTFRQESESSVREIM